MPAAKPSRLTYASVAAVLAFSALLNAAAVWAPAARAQDSSRSSESIRLAVGASKAISLQENPSTGYRWHIDTAQSSGLDTVVRVSDAGFQRGSSELPGAPGQHSWRIEALAAGNAQIVLDYSRPWETTAPAKRHTVKVTVSARR